MEAKTLKQQTRAEMLTELAFKNYNVGLIENAEHFLHLVQAMYPCNKADKLLKVIQKSKEIRQQSNSTHDNTLADLTDSVKCLKIADKPLNKTKLDTRQQGNSTDDDTLADLTKSVKSLEIADKSINEENLNKPDSNVPKEESKYEHPEQCLETTHDNSDNDYDDQEETEESGETDFDDEQENEDNGEAESDDDDEDSEDGGETNSASSGQASDDDDEEIEDSNETETQRIARALNYLVIKRYNVAEKVLERALKSFPGNELIHDISKQVQKEIKMIKEIAPRKEREHPNADNHAAEYIFLALQAKNFNYANAIMLCQLAENWNDNEASRKTYMLILKEKHPIDRRLIYKYSHTNEYLTQFGKVLVYAESLYKNMNDRGAEIELRKCYLTALPRYVIELKKLICFKIDAAENDIFDNEEEIEDSSEIEESDETAVERIARALNCLLVKDYTVADKLLGRAHKLFPSNELIYGLRKQVKKEIKIVQKIASRKEREHPNADNYAAEYTFLAIYAKNIKDYGNAIRFCILAEKWHDSEASRKTYIQVLIEMLPIDLKLIYKYSHTKEYLTQFGQDLEKAESLYKEMKNREAEIALRKCYLTAMPRYVVELKKLICSKIEAAENDV